MLSASSASARREAVLPIAEIFRKGLTFGFDWRPKRVDVISFNLRIGAIG